MSSTKRYRGSRQDLYETPSWCVEAILNCLDLDSVTSSLEPCRASGIIYNNLPGNKYYAEISEGIDYLSTQFPPPIDLIITNPPFSLAEEFLRKSLTEARCCIYLLRLNFLGSQKRKKLFQDNPLSHLYVLSKRPAFVGSGSCDSTEYAWMVWDWESLCTKDVPGVYVL